MTEPRILPQLAAPLDDPSYIKKFIQSTGWWAQEKIDGARVMIEITKTGVIAYNRKGDDIHLPKTIAADFENREWNGRWLFDGELINTKLWVFDLCRGKFELLSKPYKKRFETLEKLFADWHPQHVRLIPTAKLEPDKMRLIRHCRDSKAEGVMFKAVDSEYTPDKRVKTWYKLKFVKTADVVVTEMMPDGKAAVKIGLYDDTGKLVDAGGCAVRTDMLRWLHEGSVIEVRCLNVTPEGKLFQPAFMMARDDKAAEECTTDQLVGMQANKNVVSEGLL